MSILLLLLLLLVLVVVLVLAGIPKRKAIEEMAVADPIRPASSELVDRGLHVVAAALDQVADEEVAGAVEPVVAVDAHHHVLVFAPVVGLLLRGRPLLLVLPDLVHQLDEVGHVLYILSISVDVHHGIFFRRAFKGL